MTFFVAQVDTEPDRISASALRAIGQAASANSQARIDLRHKEGHRIPVRAWVVPIRDQQGSVIGVAQILTARSMQ